MCEWHWVSQDDFDDDIRGTTGTTQAFSLPYSRIHVCLLYTQTTVKPGKINAIQTIPKRHQLTVLTQPFPQTNACLLAFSHLSVKMSIVWGPKLSRGRGGGRPAWNMVPCKLSRTSGAVSIRSPGLVMWGGNRVPSHNLPQLLPSYGEIIDV